MSESNPIYAKNLLLLAAQRAENAGEAAASAVEELEGLLPPGRPQYTYHHTLAGEIRHSFAPPWTPELSRLHGCLPGMRSAASRSKKIAAELRRQAEVAGQYA